MAKKSMSVHFQVHGDFICELARTRLWEEDVPYSKCEDLVLSCMAGTPLSEKELKDIAQQILEGRKILQGVNVLTLEDDNENIRPLSLYMTMQQDKINILRLENKMKEQPHKYVDRFATLMSSNKSLHLEEYSYQEIIMYYRYGNRPTDKIEDWERSGNSRDMIEREDDYYLDAGLYSLNNTKLIYNIIRGDLSTSQEDMEMRLTEYWNTKLTEWYNQGLGYIDLPKDKQRVYDRNWKACAVFNMRFPYQSEEDKFKKYSEELNTNNSTEDIVSQCVKESRMRNIKTKEEATLFIEESFEPFEPYKIPDYKDLELKDLREMADSIRDAFSYVGTADKKGLYLKEYSWISPTGEWFSCDFGSHTIKSIHIVKTHKNLMNGYIEYLIKNGLEPKNKHINYMDSGHNTPCEYLLQTGWCKFHNPQGGWPYPENIRELTQKQINAIFDVAVKFKFPYDPITGQRLDWNKL